MPLLKSTMWNVVPHSLAISMLSYSKVRLSNSHHHFNKCWQKLEKEQQNLPLVEADGNLKQQLHELMAKKLEEESKNDVARLRARLQAILSCM